MKKVKPSLEQRQQLRRAEYLASTGRLDQLAAEGLEHVLAGASTPRKGPQLKLLRKTPARATSLRKAAGA